MVILIRGTTHTGKTFLAQQLLERLHFPYLSIDHLKMGLIRTNISPYTVYEDDKLTEYLWPIVVEIIKTNIENKQNIIIEGCYVPSNWKDSFTDLYLKEIKQKTLIMSEDFINENYDNILETEDIIEKRYCKDELSKEFLIEENKRNLQEAIIYSNDYILIDDQYEIDLESIIKE